MGRNGRGVERVNVPDLVVIIVIIVIIIIMIITCRE